MNVKGVNMQISNACHFYYSKDQKKLNPRYRVMLVEETKTSPDKIIRQ